MASRSTIRTNAWDVIYTYLQTTNAISTNNIFSSYNSQLAVDKGYPLVIIYPPSASFQKATLNGDITESEVSILIEVYHHTAALVKSLTDEITKKLMEGRTTFVGERLCNMEIDAGDYDTWQEGETKKIHLISFNVSFRMVSN